MFTVDTEEQARALLTLACPLNLEGEYFAEELAHEQTLENLGAFKDRLTQLWNDYVKQRFESSN